MIKFLSIIPTSLSAALLFELAFTVVYYITLLPCTNKIILYAYSYTSSIDIFVAISLMRKFALFVI